MGILISRFRSKPSTRDLLEDIEKEIEILEEYKRSTELQQKAVVRSLVFYSMLLYVIVAGVFLFYSFPVETKDRVICCIPLLIFPILLFVLKKFLHWYFIQKIRSNDENLIDLKRKKRSLLEFAMETETYKVVKELLERFDPEYHRRIFEPKPAIEAAPSTPIKGSFADMELRRRSVPPKATSPIALGPSGATISPGQTISLNTAAGHPNIFPIFHGKSPTNPPYPPAFYPRGGQPFVRPPGQPMPRPVLPRERGIVDRFVDYLVGDGPSNRYALICRQCQSHNGMALKEEFEFIAFRCCYCFTWNPPRNQHPPPPRLILPAPPGSPPAITEAPASDASSSSGLNEDETCTENKELNNITGLDGIEASMENEELSNITGLNEDETFTENKELNNIAAEEIELENPSDTDSNINLKRNSVDSTRSEQSMQERLSISSESEIQAKLEEDRPHLPSDSSEPSLQEFAKSEDAS